MNKIHEEADGAGPALVQAETGERRRENNNSPIVLFDLISLLLPEG